MGDWGVPGEPWIIDLIASISVLFKRKCNNWSMSDLIQLCYVGNLIDDDEEISIFP